MPVLPAVSAFPPILQTFMWWGKTEAYMPKSAKLAFFGITVVVHAEGCGVCLSANSEAWTMAKMRRTTGCDLVLIEEISTAHWTTGAAFQWLSTLMKSCRRLKREMILLQSKES